MIAGNAAGGAVNYLIRDDFTSDVAAGSVNGTNAEPGPGQRDTYDTGSKLVISGGVLTIANSTGSQDPTQIYNAVARRAGRILLTTITTISTGNHGRIGWSTDALDGTILDSGLRFVNTSSIATQIAGSAGPEVGSFAANTFYEVAIILRAAGFAGLVRGGIYPNWTLFWLSDAVTTTPMFPGGQVIGAGRGFTSHYMHVPAQLWLPVPLISDGFSLSGESDGLGHAEGVAGSTAGQGGDAVAWTGAAWTVSGGKASNTPVTGGDIATDGGLEAWDSGTDLTNWTEQIAGSSTINLEASDVHGGTSAARFDIDSSNSVAKISQTITNSNGDWLLVSVWAKASVAGKIIQVDENAGSNQGPALTLTTTYQQFVTLIRSTKANTDIGVKRSAGGSSSLYVDDITIEVVTLSSLLRVADAEDDDVIVTVSIERTAGSLAGLVLALDSAATPANCVFVFLDGTNYLRVAKIVAGVYTPLATTAITYVAGAELRVSKRGSSFRVYYNDAAVGSTLTISDAGIVSNTLCGLLSTSASNAFDDFTAYASGADGAYDSVLDALINAPSLTGATWAVDANGQAYNTPTLGSELVTDGGLENWDSATDLTDWIEGTGGSSTVQQSTDKNDGTYAAELTIDSSNTQASIVQSVPTEANNYYEVSAFVKQTVGAPTVRITFVNNFNFPITSTFSQYRYTARVTSTSTAVALTRHSSASTTFIFDTVSVKKITTSTLFAYVQGGAVPVGGPTARIITLANGTQAGVIGWLDDPSNPQNFIIAICDGNGNVNLTKLVAGTYTNLISSAVSFVANAAIEIRRPTGNTFQLWYNGSQVGSNQTISDSAIADNASPYFGPFSTHDGNLFTLFALAGTPYKFPGA